MVYLDDTAMITYSHMFTIKNWFVIQFSDSSFEAQVRSFLEKPSGPVYNMDFEYKKYFSACPCNNPLNWVKIQNINGMENAIDVEYLLLYGNRIQDITPLKKLEKLILLSLDDNDLEDLSPLDSLEYLKYLYLYRNRIEDLTPLKNFKELKELDLFDNRISDISSLSELKNLRFLDLSWNNLNDEDLEVFKLLPELGNLQEKKPLDLRGNLGFSEEKVRELADALPYYEYEDILWENPVREIELLSPKGGEVFSAGEEMTVSFVNSNVRDWIDLELSYDNGKTYMVLDSFETFPGKKEEEKKKLELFLMEKTMTSLEGRQVLKEVYKKPVFTDTAVVSFSLPKENSSDSCLIRAVSRLDNGVYDVSAGVFTVNPSTDVKENVEGEKENFVFLFPNPFSQELKYRVKSEKSDILSLKIYDITGQEVYQREVLCQKDEIREERIVTATWPAGIYLYRVTGQEFGKKTGKLILIK